MHDALTKSAILYGTDKFGYHDYTPNYFKLFKHLKDAEIRVLEIGVGGYADDDRGGQSLEVWRDFFPNAQVTGIDIQKKTMDLGPRVQILQGSQVDPDFLHELVKKRGPFDIIVDDGSHRNEHIVESFRLLFPTLAPGGIYVAEDVQTSFHPRFGGSLEMKAPNAVGYFGELQRRLAVADADPLLADVAGMERFHNMIALHKKADAKPRDVFASNRFEIFADHKPRVHLVGGKVTLPFKTGEVSSGTWGGKVKKGVDLLVCTLEKTTDVAAIEALFDTVKQSGIMVIRTNNAARDFAPDSAIMAYAQQRFTMVDHIEIVVHYPDATIDALAPQIYSVERYADAILFYKSPNTYPSNFAFDPANAQAAAALSHMKEVLSEATTEGGLIQFADILTRHVSREAAADTIAKLTALGATSRQYYQMAGALAQREKRMPDAALLFETALKKFPNDPQFTGMLAGAYGAMRRPADAEALLRAAMDANPRARGLIAALTKLLINKGEFDEAAHLLETTIKLFPQPMRPGRLVLLSEVQRAQSRPDAAEATMTAALAAVPDDVLVLQEMGKVKLALDDQDGARVYAKRALEVDPDNVSAKAFAAILDR